MDFLTIGTAILSSALISGIVATILSHIFESSRNKTSRAFQLKQEAYTQAIAALSGIGNRAVGFHLKRSAETGISSVGTIEYLAVFEKEIAPAYLVATQEIRDLLREATDLVQDSGSVIEAAIKSTQRTQSGYVASTAQPGGKLLSTWNDQVNEIEKKLIMAIQKDLDIAS